MGDRANVYVHDGDVPGVYLYSHWSGSFLPETVRTALARRERWDDDQYLTRIIFEEMIKDSIGGTAGYGISAYCGDGGDRIVDVDTSDQTIGIRTEDGTAASERVDFAAYISDTAAATKG